MKIRGEVCVCVCVCGVCGVYGVCVCVCGVCGVYGVCVCVREREKEVVREGNEYS
jgi:hypothetical protein